MSLSYPTMRNKGAFPVQQGFTLIEVLISLAIMAAGLLGMTALQTEGLKYDHAAFTESQAQFLLNDMLERIRANYGNNTYVLDYDETPSAVSANCETTACTSNQMAVWDMNQWRSKVEDTTYLPQGESSIDFDALTRTYVISIRYNWEQLGSTDVNGAKRTISVTTRI